MWYSVDDQDKCVNLEDVPQWDPGDSAPVVLANEHKMLVAYRLCEREAERRQLRSGPFSGVEPVAVVTFDPVFDHFFGAPNDETLHGHPLYGRGLEFYGAVEVLGSSWIRLAERRNAVHDRHNGERFMLGKRHFIFAFHDSTFECIAKGYSAKC
ncbi:MAG TPA: hypothetical protein V6C72_13885, partial [Chroococcales cyanobacterium]